MNIKEEYGEYTLTARWDGDVMRGIISGEPAVPVPHEVLIRLHGAVHDIRIYPRLMTAAEIPDHHWAYRFLHNGPGDVVIVNGEILFDRSYGRTRREWTMQSVLQHLKDCIDA